MALSLRVTTGLAPDWDELADGRAPAAARRVIEFTVDRFGAGYRTFALCDDDGSVLAAVGGTVLDSPLKNKRSDPYHIISGKCATLGLLPDGPHPWHDIAPQQVHPMLLVMSPAYQTIPVGPLAHDTETLRALVRELSGWCVREGIVMLTFLYVPDSQQALLKALGAEGGDALPLSAATVMDVVWHDFDGYLRTLPSKRRIAARRELRRLDDESIVVGTESLPGAVAELAALRGQLVAKYEGAPAAERDRRLVEHVLGAYGPDETLLMTARRGGALLNFMLFGRDGNQWTALLTGTDYTDGHSAFTYFATAFYGPARVAPVHGIDSIFYGFGSWQAKLHRGCRLEPVYATQLRVNGEGIDGPTG